MIGKDTTLPYTDTKPVGHADFYFAINATFRFILDHLGIDALRRYWRELGETYYQPVSKHWKEGGLDAVATYWRDFFKAEPDSDVEVSAHEGEVRVDVRVCPTIKHLRDNKREIVPCFCQHCHFVSEAIGEAAGITARVKGGNGSCVQRFIRAEAATESQHMEDILTAS